MKTLNVLKVFLPQGSCMLLTNVVLAWEKVSMISYLPRSLFLTIYYCCSMLQKVLGPCDLRKALPKGAISLLCGYVTSQTLF